MATIEEEMEKALTSDKEMEAVLGMGAAKPERSFGEFALKNVPESGIQFGKNLVTPILHPIETVKNIRGLSRGLGYLAYEKLGGTLDPEQKFYADKARSVGDFFSERYGGWENIKKTAYEDPVGFAADVSTLASGAGAALKAGGLTKAAGISSRVGSATNPMAWPGGAMKAGREVVSKTTLPESIYARSMKMPPGSLSEEGRARVLETMVRNEKMPLGASTRDQINSIVKDLEGKIGPTLDDLSADVKHSEIRIGPQEITPRAPKSRYMDVQRLRTEPGSQIDISKIADTLDTIKGEYVGSLDAEKYANAIEKVKQKMIDHAFVNEGQLTLADAQTMKKAAFKELETYYSKGQKPETGRIGIRNDIDAASKAKMASELRKAILSSPDVPNSIRMDLTREAGLMNARKWVERAANRGQNIDPASLSSMAFGIMIDGGISGAVAYKIATSQVIQSKLAIFLAHGSKTLRDIGGVSRPAGLGLSQSQKYGLSPQMEE